MILLTRESRTTCRNVHERVILLSLTCVMAKVSWVRVLILDINWSMAFLLVVSTAEKSKAGISATQKVSSSWIVPSNWIAKLT